ncbi:MAG: stage V sporulation protein AD [Clostridia bacterium]|nr:stage V sporulation protein AD [Clostridia bacterium]
MEHRIIIPKNKTVILSTAGVAGHEEGAGPLGGSFDITDNDEDRFGQETWEKSESEMQRLALSAALSKASLCENELSVMLAGDLLNQCVGSNYGLSGFRIPYLGLYGACSTSAEGILLGTLLCSSGLRRCAAVTSSHYCSAERQFRFPLEYGGQRPPTAQWTVTASGAFIISSDEGDIENAKETVLPTVTGVLPGYIIDKGISDVNNMGAAMAPAAADTILRYFKLSGDAPCDFDMIVTGDLGREGSGILVDLLYSEGLDISKQHVDCGCMIYNADEADKHAGGSGCGCSAVVMASHILPNITYGKLKNVLFIGTGALMSPLVLNQGGTIPGVGHLIRFRGDGGM